MQISPRFVAALVALAVLSACQSTQAEPPATRLFQPAPPGAPPGTCWGKTETPALIETVTEQVIVQPAETGADGAVVSPAVYRTETRQQIVRERRETWFETPCPEVLTPEFVASLQRALAARGLYRGAETGEMDRATRAAIRRYQAPDGVDSGILSLEAARRLGLVAMARAPDPA